MNTRLSLISNVFILSSLLAFSHGLLKWVARKEVENYLDLVSSYWLQIGFSLLIYGFVFFYYIHVLRKEDIAILYSSYTGLSILLVLSIGIFFFGETLSFGQIGGGILIIAGIVLIGIT